LARLSWNFQSATVASAWKKLRSQKWNLPVFKDPQFTVIGSRLLEGRGAPERLAR
jgi:hypothetical protein